MPNKQTKKQLKKLPEIFTKPRRIFIIVTIILAVAPLTLWLYNYIDMRINKPLGSGNDFVFIQQEISKGGFAVPTETFYYATNVPPQEFASKFDGWSTRGNLSSTETGTRTDITIEKGNLHANAVYCSRQQCEQDPIGVSDFKGKKYIVYILGASMYYLNPGNIHWSMKQQVQEDIRDNYIR